MSFTYQFFILFTCIAFFSCKSKPLEQSSRDYKAIFTVDSIPKVNLAKTSSLIEFDSRLDSLSIIREAKTNSLMIQDTLYKWSRFNKSFLTYHDKKNRLFSTDGTELGDIDLEANNPEFYIETFPSDNQSIIYLDAINELVNYKTNEDGVLSKDWSISLNNSAELFAHYMSSKENELILLFSENENTKLIIQTINLVNGEIIQSKMIEKGKLHRVHYLGDQIVALSDFANLIVVDYSSNIRDTITINSRIQNIVAYRTEINTEVYFSYKDTVFQSIITETTKDSTFRLLVGEDYKLGSMVKLDRQVAIPYYQLNPSDTTDMSNLLLSQGIFLYNLDSQSMKNIEFPYRESYHKLLYLDKNLYIIYGEKAFVLHEG